MGIISKVNNKVIKARYYNEHKVSYIIIRICLLPLILIVMLFQLVANITDKVSCFLGNFTTELTYFIYKVIHYKHLEDKEREE